jgi:hypothetical protein
VQGGPGSCPDYACHAGNGQDKTEAQAVMHTNDLTTLTESMEDANPHTAPSAIVQTIAEVALSGF